MSTTFRPEIYTKDALMDYYKSTKYTLFRIYVGTQTKYDCQRFIWEDETNKNGAEQALEEACDMILSDPRNTNCYTLQIIKEVKMKPARNAGKPEMEELIVACAIGFKLNNDSYGRAGQNLNGVTIINPGSEGEKRQINVPAGNDYGMQLFEMMKQQNLAMQERMERLEEQLITRDIPDPYFNGYEPEDNDDDEEDKPVSGSDRVLGAIGAILEKPAVQEAIPVILMGIMSRFFDNKTNANNGNEINK